MTTRGQRERLIRLDQLDDVFSDEACRRIWTKMFPRQGRALARDFPRALRVCVRAYLEMARIPSRGEIDTATRVLYRRLLLAIEANDRDAAAAASENMPEAARAELDRLTPGGIPTPMQIRDPQHGIEKAKELLGCCLAGAKIVPGRKRPNNQRSRPTLKLLPRFTQARGFPPQEPEMLLVRALAEYYRSLNGGRFPRAWAHDQSKAWSPFERLVDDVLRGCGDSRVNTLKLVRRTLDEMRDAELSPI
jgi:hypothetical protein